MPELTKSFEYEGLEEGPRLIVQQRTTEIRDRMGRAAQNIVEIGTRLLDVKGQLPYGQFQGWLRSEFDWSESAATKMMQVGEQFKSVNFTDLSIAPSALYLLASPSTPEPVRAAVIQRAKSGEKVTHAAVKKVLGKAKPDVEMVPKAELEKAVDTARFLRSQVHELAAAAPATSPKGIVPPPTAEESAASRRLADGLLAMAKRDVDAAEPKPVECPPVTEDVAGTTLPDVPAIRDAFAAVPLVQRVLTIHNQMMAALTELYESPAGARYAGAVGQRIKAAYREGRKGVFNYQPHSVCRDCRGTGMTRKGDECGMCGKLGWITRETADRQGKGDAARFGRDA